MTISLITATYNSGSTIEGTLKSVLAQTYNDIDYWIIDGGSKDNTMEIVRRYEPQFDGRLHWISEKDGGIYDAMNKGISNSTGDVVGILNSDDYFTADNVLERVATEMKAHTSLDAIYGDIHFIKDGFPNRVVRYYSSNHSALCGFALALCLHIRRSMLVERCLTNTDFIRSTTRLRPTMI